jgi:HD-GYP domain-containing protein (c-di-GMP phosphodiesterase class II)
MRNPCIPQNDSCTNLLEDFQQLIGKLKDSGLFLEEAHQIKKDLIKILTRLNSLEEINENVNEFFHIFVHRFKSPLTTIKAYASFLLSKDLKIQPKKQKEFLKTIVKEVDFLDTLLKDIICSFDLRSGKINLNWEDIDLKVIVEELIQIFQIKDRNHHFESKFLSSLPKIKGDGSKIKEVIATLLDNSVKYSSDGTKIEIGVYQHKNRIHLWVEDEGIGIPEGDQLKLFNKFTRGEGQKEDETSFGLGLYIVKSIVEAHKGDVWIESKKGSGTKVWVCLPIEHDPDEDAERSEFMEIKREFARFVKDDILKKSIDLMKDCDVLQIKKIIKGQIVERLIKLIDLTNPYTKDHSMKVAEFAMDIASRLGLEEKERLYVKLGSLFHDIGNLSLPEKIIFKPVSLNADELRELKESLLKGVKILEETSLKEIIPAILYHHERYDGKGYPFGLKGDQIPISARIIAVAEAFVAMTSLRPYRGRWSYKEALKMIQASSGKHFDPRVVDALVEVCQIGIRN